MATRRSQAVKQRKLKTFISKYRRSSDRKRRLLIQRAPPWLIKMFMKGSSLYLKGRIPLDTSCRSKLNRHHSDLAQLSRCRNVKQAKRVLVQRGGFVFALPALAIAAGKAIAGALAGAAATAGIKKLLRRGKS